MKINKEPITALIHRTGRKIRQSFGFLFTITWLPILAVISLASLEDVL